MIVVSAKELTKAYGEGFDYSSLYKFVRFYKAFPEILDSVSPKSVPLLSWMHNRTLLQVEDEKVCTWYMKEAWDEDIARYSILHGNEQLFASKYKLYLSTEELRAEIEAQKVMFYLQQQEKESD